ncbi:MAG: T9SS type A sorting domain-containing protein [Bacteroidales bacterium]|nr:T9SS type A sorting domain-containing protein [Bacteroidales bacterium]
MTTKTRLMIALLAMATLCLRAQEYDPLVGEGKQWNEVLTYVPWPPIHRETNAYKMDGDTLLEGTSYMKLFTTKDEQYDNWEFCGLIRETYEGQVFYRKYRWDHGFEAETMLYDFSMQPGDSICYDESCCLLLLRKNDTIFDDGSIRKRYDFQYKEHGYLWEKYETWIEGIGSELGLLRSGSLSLVGGTYDLLCYYEDEDLVWQNPNFNSCYISADGVEENEKESLIAVYPNPVGELLHIIYLQESTPTVIKLYDLQGRLVRTQRNGLESLDMSQLPAGTYTIRVTLEDGKVFSDKVVKE